MKVNSVKNSVFDHTKRAAVAALLAFMLACFGGCGTSGIEGGGSGATTGTTIEYTGDGSVARDTVAATAPTGEAAVDLASIPDYSGAMCIEVNDSIPGFTEDDLHKSAFLSFTDLDFEGRCGTAFGMLGPETVSDEKRGDISHIHPSGWEQKHYDFIDGGVLFTRSHLIAHQLSGENANERNLISGTKTFNADAMTCYEELVGDYIRETGNHVLYRVTPIFAAYDLVVRGVQMEALSVEDGGEAICYNVFVYNVEPGVQIDYTSGDSWESSDVVAVKSLDETTKTTGADGRAAKALAYASGSGNVAASGDAGSSGDTASKSDSSNINSSNDASNASSATNSTNSNASTGENSSQSTAEQHDYVLNTGSKKFHYPDCAGVEDISSYNRKDYTGTREALIADGYTPCGQCQP